MKKIWRLAIAFYRWAKNMRETGGCVIPDKYKFVEYVGDGHCGVVAKFLNTDNQEIVAVKCSIVYGKQELEEEILTMELLMKHNLDQHNIVKYKRRIVVQHELCAEYECLDMTVEKYISQNGSPMQLDDIRTIIQQIAVALDALHKLDLIHTCVTEKAIMMVDHTKRPLKVKLIHFRHVTSRHDTIEGEKLQPVSRKAPEILLGLPYSESIDVWSLGCTLANMMSDRKVFYSLYQYDTLQFIMNFLGPPPAHLLEAGRKTHKFFDKKDNFYILKGYMGYDFLKENNYSSFPNLDEMTMNFMRSGTLGDAIQRRECVKLLKAMLQWDQRDRITIREILNHPFISQTPVSQPAPFNTWKLLQKCLVMCKKSKKPEPSTNQVEITEESTLMTPTEDITSQTESQPPGVILVRPATPSKRSPLTDSSDEDRQLISQSVTVDAPSSQDDLEIVSITCEDEEDNEDEVDEKETDDSSQSVTVDAPSSQVDPEIPSITCEDKEDNEDEVANKETDEKKKKKKKNCFRRFVSWIRKKITRGRVSPM